MNAIHFALGLAALRVSRFAGRIFNDANTPEALEARLQEINARCLEIQGTADAEARDLTDEELDEIEALQVEFDAKRRQLDSRNRTAAMNDRLGDPNPRAAAPPPAGTQPDPNPRATPAAPRVTTRERMPHGQWGFNDMGDFARSVVRAVGHQGMDDRLSRVADMARAEFGIRGAAGEAAVERIGEEGGFLVPPDFRTGVEQKVSGEESLLGRTDNQTVSGNSFTVPVDETTPWQTSGGIQASWEGEDQQIPGSRPRFNMQTTRANKVTALVPVSDELLEDAPALGGYIERKAGEKIDWKVTFGIVQGTGVGQPQGILNADALVAVAKEAAQGADTVVYENVINMYAAMYAPARRRAIWLINQDIEPQLFSMVIEGSSGGVFPVYQPAGQAASAPNGTLMGRPIVPTEACETLGDQGDIILWDPQGYMSVTKRGGVQAASSMHLYFDYGETAFRFVMRIGGQPWWGSGITKRAGGTLSNMVTLAARA